MNGGMSSLTLSAAPSQRPARVCVREHGATEPRVRPQLQQIARREIKCEVLRGEELYSNGADPTGVCKQDKSTCQLCSSPLLNDGWVISESEYDQ